jgi:hypothetical protein
MSDKKQFAYGRTPHEGYRRGRTMPGQQQKSDSDECEDVSKHVPDPSLIPYIRGFNKTGHVSEEKAKQQAKDEKEYAGLAFFKDFFDKNGYYAGCVDSVLEPSQSDVATMMMMNRLIKEKPMEKQVPVVRDIPKIDGDDDDDDDRFHDIGVLIMHLQTVYTGDPIIHRLGRLWKKHKATRVVTIPQRSFTVPDLYSTTKNATRAGMEFVTEATAPMIKGMQESISKLKSTSMGNRTIAHRLNGELGQLRKELRDVYQLLSNCVKTPEGRKSPQVVMAMVQDASEQISDVGNEIQDLHQQVVNLSVSTNRGLGEANMVMEGTVEEGLKNINEMIRMSEQLVEQASEPSPPLPPRDTPPPPSANVETAAGVADAMKAVGGTLAQQLMAMRTKMGYMEEEEEEEETSSYGQFADEDEWGEDISGALRRSSVGRVQKSGLTRKDVRPSYADLIRQRKSKKEEMERTSETCGKEKGENEDSILDTDIHIALKLSDKKRTEGAKTVKEDDDDDEPARLEPIPAIESDEDVNQDSDEYW